MGQCLVREACDAPFSSSLRSFLRSAGRGARFGTGQASHDDRRTDRRSVAGEPAPLPRRNPDPLHPDRHGLEEERPHDAHPSDRRRRQRRGPAHERGGRGIQPPLVPRRHPRRLSREARRGRAHPDLRDAEPGRGSLPAHRARQLGGVVPVLARRQAHLLRGARSEERRGEEEGQAPGRRLRLRRGLQAAPPLPGGRGRRRAAEGGAAHRRRLLGDRVPALR